MKARILTAIALTIASLMALPTAHAGSGLNGSFQNGAGDNGANENGANENGANENGANENGANENGANENGTHAMGTGRSPVAGPTVVVIRLRSGALIQLR